MQLQLSLYTHTASRIYIPFISSPIQTTVAADLPLIGHSFVHRLPALSPPIPSAQVTTLVLFCRQLPDFSGKKASLPNPPLLVKRPFRMTSLVPREAYTPEEIEQLYPKDLKLQLVQVVCCSHELAANRIVISWANIWIVSASWCESSITVEWAGID